MKEMKVKIKPKSREEIEKEIDDILAGKDKSPRGIMLRNASKALKFHKTNKEIRDLFVEEYVKKYGELSSGKKSVEQLKEESLADIKKAKTTGTLL